MKKVWFGVGIVAIIILLLLVTRFTQYTQLEENGYAVKDDGVAAMLMRDLDDGKIERIKEMGSFACFDWIYKRGNSYYLGEEKKIAIDYEYPLYLNNGATIKLTSEKGKLYDKDYLTLDVYDGLMLNNGVSYNPGGERADACDFIFYAMNNGLFINTLEMSMVDVNGVETIIPLNSIVYFTRDHLTFYAFNNGTLEYNAVPNLTDETSFFVGGDEIDYYNLLLNLELIHVKNEHENDKTPGEEIKFEEPENELGESDESLITAQTADDKKNSNDKDKNSKDKKKRDHSDDKSEKEKVTTPKPIEPRKPSTNSSVDDEEVVAAPATKNNATISDNKPRGVRPDSMRPDKMNPSDTPQREPVAEYVKPTVTVGEIDPRVYRVLVPLKVSDPARRLYSGRKVQVEIYEIDDKGKEKLAMRSYVASSDTITLGDGAVKPNTNYRVNIYFTYLDEYDRMTVENVISQYVKTGSIAPNAHIALSSKTIDIYYDNMVLIPGVHIIEEESDEELVYAIKRSGGVVLVVDNSQLFSGYSLENIQDGSTIRDLKDGKDVNIRSAAVLKPNNHYDYTITAKDFFDNPIELTGNTGEFYTSKGRPATSLGIVNNVIGATTVAIGLSDVDDAALSSADGSGKHDIYVAVTTARIKTTKEECDKFLKGQTVSNNALLYVYKLKPEDYTTENGHLKVNALELEIQDLKPDTRFYASIYTDFDLNNGAGPVRFGDVGTYTFNSASFNTLGYVYVNVDILDVGYDSATVIYGLNTTKTSEKLVELIGKARFEIVREELVSETEEDKVIKKVSDVITDFDTAVFENFRNGDDIKIELDGLRSMEDYVIEPTLKVLYNGEYYNIKTVLSNNKFKTMRKPARVENTNVLLAAGTLRFTTKVIDEDGAITGNSGNTVVMNIYQNDGTFVRAMRIKKNEETDIEITGLTGSNRYIINYVAVEYNEGYSNATYVSNKVIEEISVEETIKISGDIKLQELDSSKTKLNIMDARLKATFKDPNMEMLSRDYYIQVEKDGVVVATDKYNHFTRDNYSSDGETVSNNQIKYEVDAGEHEYELTLYLEVNGHRLIIDSIKFVTEQAVIPIYNEYEFIYQIKKNQGRGKYLVCDNLVFDSQDKYSPDHVHGGASTGFTPKYITRVNSSDITVANSFVETENTLTEYETYFNGEIDFQGYSFSYNYKKDDSNMFRKMGANANLHDVVFRFSMLDGDRIIDEGFICRLNYGRIHDFYLIYEGGGRLANYTAGLLCDYNAVSGVIENFVVKNEMGEGTLPLTARNNMGLLCYQNNGIVRNGYVYGNDIYTAVQDKGYGELYVGGLMGHQGNAGQTTNVYSLINVIVQDPSCSSDKKTANSRYGAIIGSGGGRVSNVYSVGQSTYTKVYNEQTFDPNRGPVIGNDGTKNTNVFYWNEANYKYTTDLSKNQNMINLATLYDYGWQSKILGSQFDTQPVEVGYYPHVIISQELPPQEYIKLPVKNTDKIVDVMNISFIEYADDEEQSAIIEVRLSNPRNAEILSVNIESLTTEIFRDSFESEDGYTTFKAKVSNPQKFLSEYKLQSIEYSLDKRKDKVVFDPEPLLAVDFYRGIYTTKDWKDYVVGKPTENAKLMADLDFTGVAENDIYVKEFRGKLHGNGDETTPGHSLNNITMLSHNSVINEMYGSLMHFNVNNLTIGNTTGKGTNKDAYIQGHGGFVFRIRAFAENIHLNNVNVVAYSYVGSLAAEVYTSAEVKNCSAQNVKITYKEKTNSNTDARVGGLFGRTTEARVSNCYVTNLDLTVEEAKNCIGAGGVIGECNTSVVKALYAQGSVNVRGSNVGGVIGSYTGGEVTGCMESLISHVSVVSYQDNIGGLVGITTINSQLDSTTNMSGVAFGNVMASNAGATQVSYTIGNYMGGQQHFYGTTVQLFNGATDIQEDENTENRMLTEEQYTNPLTYTNIVHMTKEYDYSYVSDGNLPHLYYEGTSVELPNQPIIPIRKKTTEDNKIKVKNVKIENSLIVFRLDNPEGYTITGFEVEDLLLEELNPSRVGLERVEVAYKPEKDQTRWKDSYNLMSISYEKKVGDEIITGKTDYSADPVLVPLTLYIEIDSVIKWNQYINAMNNYGNYDNYKITDDINFAGSGSYTYNVKLGRLVGAKPGGTAKLSGINIAGKNNNFIFRLNTEMKNLEFEDCSIQDINRTCVGLVGVSSAKINNVKFKDISIENRYSTTVENNRDSQGIIGYQIGGEISNITMENIRVGYDTNKFTNNYIGGLVGYVRGNTHFNGIKAKNIFVRGYRYVGGIVGYIDRAQLENIEVEDADVKANYCYVGGVIGYNASSRTANKAPYLRNVSIKGTIYEDEEHNKCSTTTISFIEDNITYDDTYEGAYIGGIAGRENGYKNGWNKSWDSLETNNIFVDGVIVKGYGNYIGGAFGYVHDACNVKVTNTIVTECKPYVDGIKQYVGGITGYAYCYSANNIVDNVIIDIRNHSNVGGIAGTKDGNGTSAYNLVTESTIKDTLTTDLEITNVGGLFGTINGTVRGGVVLNTNVVTDSTVDGKGINNVGGIAGYLNSTLNTSFYYAEPTSDTNPCAKPEYKVEGASNVGGAVGYQYAGNINRCYTNANVNAKQYYAGGLTGAYNNGYTADVISGKKTYGFSTVYCYYNYATGTVHASKYAGGFFGQTTMAKSGAVCPEHQAYGARANNKTIVADHASGSAYEGQYTYRNMILCQSVKADDGNNFVFSGTTESFERIPKKANTYPNAYLTFIWDGMLVGDNDLRSNTNYTEYSKGLNTQGFYKVKSDSFKTKENAVDLFTRIEWYNLTSVGRKTDSMVARWFRIIVPGIADTPDTSAEWTTNIDPDDFYKDKAYLPHVRYNEDKGAFPDELIKRQAEWKIALPIPANYDESKIALAAAYSMDYIAPEINVYASGVDTLNLEFSEGMENGGRYTVKDGMFNVLIDEPITSRVVTIKYDYNTDLFIDFGIDEDINSVNVSPYSWPGIVCPNKKEMVYGNYYYYISRDMNEQIVKGGITDSITSIEEEESHLVKTKDSYTCFLHMYGGKAIDTEGNVYNLESGSVEYKFDKIRKLDNAIPIQRFDYDGQIVETYYGLTQYIGNSVVTKPSQFFLGQNGETAMFNNYFDRDKTTALIYMKNKQAYNTVLTYDASGYGYLLETEHVDGGDIGAPSGFENSHIISMTDNFSRTGKITIPVVLVRYEGDHVEGYNYQTEQWVVHRDFEKNMGGARMGLMDFAREYFVFSPIENFNYMGANYLANMQLINEVHDGEALDKYIVQETEEASAETEIASSETEIAKPDKNFVPEEDMGAGSEKEGTNIKEGQNDKSGDAVGDESAVASEAGIGNGEAGNGNAEKKLEDQLESASDIKNDDSSSASTQQDSQSIKEATEKVEPDGQSVIEEFDDENTLSQNELIEEQQSNFDNSEKLPAKDELEELADLDGSKEVEALKTDELDKNAEKNKHEESKADAGSSKSSKLEHEKYESSGVLISYSGIMTGDNNSEEKSEEAATISGNIIDVNDIDRSELSKANVGNNLRTVYNPETGMYEIIDMDMYTKYKDYKSENDRLGIPNLADAAGFATQTEDRSRANGVVLYIIIASGVIALVAILIAYRKKHITN